MSGDGSINFVALEAALKTFQEAVRNPPQSLLERDGIIQRFEYTFELCWKSIRKLLIHMGRSSVSSSPKPLLRDAHQENLIDDIERWFVYVDARNRTSHSYNPVTAESVYEDIKDFGDHAQGLLDRLNARSKNC